MYFEHITVCFLVIIDVLNRAPSVDNRERVVYEKQSDFSYEMIFYGTFILKIT